MHLSSEISIGNLLTAAGMIAALWTFHKANVKRVNHMEFKVNLMWKRFAHKFELPENLDDDEYKN